MTSIHTKPTSLREWHHAIYKLDGGKCAVCGSTDRLTGHHILPRGTYPEYKFELWNGLLLCWDCHLKPHHGSKTDPQMVKSVADSDNSEFWSEYVPGIIWMLRSLETIFQVNPDYRCVRAYLILKKKEKI